MTEVKQVSGNSLHNRPLKYFDFFMAAFVAILLLSNVIGASKLSTVTFANGNSFTFGAGVMFFPLGYLLGDILTEVYGYAHARRCIWVGFAALIFMAFMSWVVVALPPSPDWHNQQAYENIFGQVPRIVFASITAFWLGEFVNSFVMAKMKLITKGKYLWTRTIGSTIVGQAVDSLFFYPLAFWNAAGWTHEGVIAVMIGNWALKVGWEAALTPVTYLVVNFLKKKEGLDVYDDGTNFTPFEAKV